MAEIRNLTRNGETFYPLTCTEGLVNRDGNVVGEINDIFDISEYNASGTPPVLAKYETLSLALAVVPTSKQKGGMTIRYVQTSDNKYVQYRLMNQSFSTTESDWQGVDNEPTAGSNNLVKSGGVKYNTNNSLVGLNSDVYGNRINLIGSGIKSGYIDAEGVFHKNNSYVLFDVSTCRGLHITMTEGTSTQYAFLKDYNSEKVLFVSGGGRVSGTLDNTEIPSDALYLYMYTGAYSTAVVPTLEISESTNPGIISLLNQKRVITGNIYKSHTQISSISDVLSSLPTYVRLGNSILVFRDNDYQIHVFVFKSEIPSDTNWNNVSLWKELAYKDDIEGLEQDVYNIIDNSNVSPLVFNKVSESVAVLDNNIVLSQDGDSIELSVKTNCLYVEGSPNTPAGYGFALSNEGHGIGIGLSSNRIAVRADDSTWILRGGSTEPYYNPQKNTYVLKISYESGNILTYVDGNLVNTYTGQKTITIKSFGNGANLTYGYWDGIIYWLKVNGKIYNIPYLSSMSNVEKVVEQYPNMLFEKTADSINVYRRLDGDNYIKYAILKAYKSYTEGEYPSFYDNWGLRQVSKCKFDGISTITDVETLFRDGEAECAIAVQRGANYGTSQYPYVGGSTHGFDNIKVTDGKRHFIIMVDNSSIGESDIVQLKAVKNVQIKQESSLYQAYTNSSPWGEVVKKWTFDGSGVFIETKIKWLRDILVYKCQQGMMCVYRHWLGNTSNTYLTNKAAKDNEYVVYNVEDGWESEPVNAPLKNVDNGCNKITEWGQKGLGFSLEIIDDNRAQSGGMDVGTNNSSYNKIYFSTINNTEVATISSGTIHYATQKWEIYKN